ncbi:hypothetical protein EVAR_99634_1 [Eumeta japonica]|uniref:Proteasome inhibitor PI31 subunit n=1 Tax=Eumeta variegata TaxID=151549 RepID=A0A4C1ZXL0_EUMVA|nr:hypothetical protein EVAR_99634_1 [Eumeta japonica]
MATHPLYGWDLTFKTVEKDIKRKEDIIVAFLHWQLAKRGESSTSRSAQDWRPHSTDHVIRDYDRPTYPNLWVPPEASPYGVGRSDLDPFGVRGSGGGMLFNPFGSRDLDNPGLGIPGGLPRGAFHQELDSILSHHRERVNAGTTSTTSRHRSLPPPGFNDHMFM